jgi:two-component system, NtrC family, sensor kinase
MISPKPAFWDYRDTATVNGEQVLNYRRIWKLAIFLIVGVSLIPIFLLTAVDYHISRKAVVSENLLRTARLVSNAQRTVFAFMDERMAALNFIAIEKTLPELNDQVKLAKTLENLKKSFGGFTDIGVIDPSGTQSAYVGPFDLAGRNYSDQTWHKEVLSGGVYMSEVFLGFRRTPHRVIAVKHSLPSGSSYILRATLDTKKFDQLIAGLEIGENGDAFIINKQGILQTPSLSHGNVLEKVSLPVPEYAPKTRVFEGADPRGTPLIIGYKYITGTPFILMVVKQEQALLTPWYETRLELMAFLTVSSLIILSVVIGMVTFFINKIYALNQTRIATLHQVEYANKMASVGRLAAGVAHEVNNPLAIINEKAGLIKDLITYKQQYTGDSKLAELVDAILASVKRAGTITKRLLSFSRHSEVSIQPVQLKELIEEVLSFTAKEAEYRGITISIDAAENMPAIESDRGKLQEIFLNLFNNACLAMDDGGCLTIEMKPEGEDRILVTVSDDGCGIDAKNLERIFEPFYSTRTKKGGTGLGLSLTANFVRELGGILSVESETGKGTTFSIQLPLKITSKQLEDACACY